MAKKQSIPSWVWILISFLIIAVILLFAVMNQSVKVNSERSSGETLCLDQCGLNQGLCFSSVEVLKENRDCYAEYKSCIRDC